MLRCLNLHVLTGALEPARNAEPGAAASAEGGAAPAENGSVSRPPANAAAGLPWAVLFALASELPAGSQMNLMWVCARHVVAMPLGLLEAVFPCSFFCPVRRTTHAS